MFPFGFRITKNVPASFGHERTALSATDSSAGVSAAAAAAAAAVSISSSLGFGRSERGNIRYEVMASVELPAQGFWQEKMVGQGRVVVSRVPIRIVRIRHPPVDLTETDKLEEIMQDVKLRVSAQWPKAVTRGQVIKVVLQIFSTDLTAGIKSIRYGLVERVMYKLRTFSLLISLCCFFHNSNNIFFSFRGLYLPSSNFPVATNADPTLLYYPTESFVGGGPFVLQKTRKAGAGGGATMDDDVDDFVLAVEVPSLDTSQLAAVAVASPNVSLPPGGSTSEHTISVYDDITGDAVTVRHFVKISIDKTNGKTCDVELPVTIVRTLKEVLGAESVIDLRDIPDDDVSLARKESMEDKVGVGVDSTESDQ
jgi:hypothetical protein